MAQAGNRTQPLKKGGVMTREELIQAIPRARVKVGFDDVQIVVEIKGDEKCFECVLKGKRQVWVHIDPLSVVEISEVKNYNLFIEILGGLYKIEARRKIIWDEKRAERAARDEKERRERYTADEEIYAANRAAAKAQRAALVARDAEKVRQFLAEYPEAVGWCGPEPPIFGELLHQSARRGLARQISKRVKRGCFGDILPCAEQRWEIRIEGKLVEFEDFR